MITLIAAIGKNKELGFHNEMPWHLPKDFKHFKAKTTGHTIVMGRKTLESYQAFYLTANILFLHAIKIGSTKM